jgi:hypothetical protein
MTAVKIFGLVVSLALGACAVAPKNSTNAPGATTRPLVAPASLGSDRVVNQVVRAAYGARELTAYMALSPGINVELGSSHNDVTGLMAFRDSLGKLVTKPEEA